MSDYIRQDRISGKLQDGKSFTYLMQYAKPLKNKYLLALVLLASSALASISIARLIGLLVEDGLVAKNATLSFQISILIIVIYLAVIGLTWQGRKLLARCACETILEIRKKVFSHIHHLPMSYYDREPQGRVITRMTHDIEGIEEFITSTLGRLVTVILMLILSISAMLLTHWKLGGILSLMTLPAIWFTWYGRKMIKKINREVSVKNSQCNAKLSEYINGINVIRSYGIEDYTQNQYQKAVDEHLVSILKSNFFNTWSRPLSVFLCELPLLFLLIYGGGLALKGELSVGLFVAFIGYCERFTSPLTGIAREVAIIQQAFTSAERVTTFLQAKIEDDELGDDGDNLADEIKGSIEFRSVEMSYGNNEKVLQDLSFKVEPGQKIGLVGRTGSGKSTTVSLLSRLYAHQAGSILIDQLPIEAYARQSLRSAIGFVSQDVMLFKGSLKENLICEAEMSDDFILQACQQTGLSEIMLKNNFTLDSLIEEQGANLSVGEKQLVALTRILLRNPKILILDEATANIDEKYEKLIHHAVDRVMQNRTCLIIAHRLATLKSCDQIFVFKAGRLVEQGTQSELMSRKEVFYQLQLNSDNVI
jgi:ABC-type multidrug transport system fused ATPase/permease subunit